MCAVAAGEFDYRKHVLRFLEYGPFLLDSSEGVLEVLFVGNRDVPEHVLFFGLRVLQL